MGMLRFRIGYSFNDKSKNGVINKNKGLKRFHFQRPGFRNNLSFKYNGFETVSVSIYIYIYFNNNKQTI